MRILLLTFLCSLLSYGQQIPAPTKADLQLIQKEFIVNNHKVSEAMRLKFPIHNLNGQEYVSFLVKVNATFSKQDFLSRGINIGSRIQDIVTVRYPIEQLDQITNESAFEYIKIAGKLKPLLDNVKIGTRVDSVWQGINLPQSYTGKNVIIGVQDWGFDYTSPMFYDTLLQNSRILAAWDQFKTSGPAPAGKNYGTEFIGFTELQNQQSDTAGIYGYATHGTHVAGIAGGSGAGTEHRGMAFESDLIFTSLIIDESFAIDGWDWMYNFAQSEGKRLVVNMSWGVYHLGSLDGTDLLQQALDSYSDLGVTFCTSAGNNGDAEFHIKKDYDVDDTLKTQIEFQNSGQAVQIGQNVFMWGEAGNSYSTNLFVTDNSNNVLVESNWYHTQSSPAFIDTFLVASGTDTIFFNLAIDSQYPSNNRPHIRLQVKDFPSGYKIGMHSTASTGIVHYWNVIAFSNGAGNWGIPFSGIGTGSTVGNNQYGIGQPACSEKAISVAAYFTEYYSWQGNLIGGTPAGFSSEGPLLDESLKPDITAPGVTVVSSMNSFTQESFTPVNSVQFNGRTYYFASLSGTSMAGPVCSGIAAIILEANPYLSPDQVKDIIIQSARTDQHTGTIPPHNSKWGWGKLNAYKAIELATANLGTEEIAIQAKWNLYPNPTSNQLSIEGLEGELSEICIFDLTGKKVYENQTDELTLNVSNLQTGMYILRLNVDGKIQQKKFVKE